MFEMHTDETHSQHCCSSVDDTAACLTVYAHLETLRRVQLNG